jgi:hypothetical protein
MIDDLIGIGFTVDTDGLKAGLSQATQNVGDAAGAIADQLARIGESARAAYEPLKTLAEQPDNKKAIEDAFAEQVTQIQILKQLGQISADDAIAQQMRVENAKYASLRAELEAAKECMTEEEAAREHLQAQADAEELKHDAKMRQLQLEAVKDSQTAWMGIIQPISGAFQSSLNGIIQGNETLRQATAKMGLSIVTQFADMAVKRAADWIASELTMTEATAAGAAARGAAEQAGQGASLALNADTALKRIGSSAAETYAGVFAWASPELGPLAVVPATAAAALVLAKEALVPSAAGGWDVPSGLNPLTQLHEREMVLPQRYADVIRGLGAGGGVGAGGGGGDIHLHVQAMDAQGVKKFMLDNKDSLAAALRAAYRNFSTALA